MSFAQTIIITILGGLVGGSISYYLSKRTESYRFDLLKREQAAKIANLLAKWGKYSAMEGKILTKKELYDYYEEITSLSYELSLWISDEELVKKLMERLQNKPNALETTELLIKIREHILDKETEILKADEIVRWPAN